MTMARKRGHTVAHTRGGKEVTQLELPEFRAAVRELYVAVLHVTMRASPVRCSGRQLTSTGVLVCG
jgi:hypothetical protein